MIAPNDAPKDHQDRYDEDLNEYTTGQALENFDAERSHAFAGRFPRDFYRYSQDFHDREDGAPGTDQDFGTKSDRSDELPPLAKPIPEGNGEAESQSDRETRGEIMDLLTREVHLDASDVSVRVEDGVATISGSARDARMGRALEESVRQVPGVDEVRNCLIVGASNEARSPL